MALTGGLGAGDFTHLLTPAPSTTGGKQTPPLPLSLPLPLPLALARALPPVAGQLKVTFRLCCSRLSSPPRACMSPSSDATERMPSLPLPMMVAAVRVATVAARVAAAAVRVATAAARVAAADTRAPPRRSRPGALSQ
eukprot:CAMPEP_0181229058 /NCGR_PEP_ID=MMETSP1096-20121128/33687_1 /TAXON_ID=156174 ORGANISM="Chrysochromulina ericina, Strain CCMP281" /NCGR_SAMPLE_ID=MMETSP1096 /ASSEMBLY_ACC=CAM_ASM_000453 /LENGTH=137 /DNA_ID=CAMNT_0023322641 /DNA_START=187 /DNA_END=598 /DNA_ORIENTATION=-